MSTIESQAHPNLAKLETQLKAWGAKLDEAMTKAKGKAGGAGRDVKAGAEKELAQLKVMFEGARAKLDEAKAAGSDKWADLKDGVERTWKELEGAFTKLVH